MLPTFRSFRSRALALVAATSIAALAALSGCGDDDEDGPTNPGPTSNVSIVSGAMSLGANAFSPNPDSVSVGTTVIWKNNDTITHTVTSNTAGQFNLTIGAGAQASHKFSSAGTFDYHCTIGGHTMTGRVVVTP